MTDKTTALYAKDYNRGWRCTGSLDAADDRGDGMWNDAWMDGYLDCATGRPKWHLRDCPDHDACGLG